MYGLKELLPQAFLNIKTKKEQCLDTKLIN